MEGDLEELPLKSLKLKLKDAKIKRSVLKRRITLLFKRFDEDEDTDVAYYGQL